MSEALQGTAPRGVTLTEQANGRRIPRSMFIGHSAGYMIFFAIIPLIAFGIETYVARLGGAEGAASMSNLIEAHVDLAMVPSQLHLDLLSGNLVLKSVLFAVSLLVWLDLIVRRRHDRGRSGIDGIVWLVLLAASQVLFKLSILPEVVRWLDLAVYAGALYLFVVLVLLPGNRHENRYGAVPRPD